MARCYGVRMEELFNQFGWRLTLDEAALPDGKRKLVETRESRVSTS